MLVDDCPNDINIIFVSDGRVYGSYDSNTYSPFKRVATVGLIPSKLQRETEE
jgi:hypothetical protein